MNTNSPNNPSFTLQLAQWLHDRGMPLQTLEVQHDYAYVTLENGVRDVVVDQDFVQVEVRALGILISTSGNKDAVLAVIQSTLNQAQNQFQEATSGKKQQEKSGNTAL